MSLDEIHELLEAYARAATLAQKVGFGGVLIHAGHGILFSQFLSPLFDHRNNAHGDNIEDRFRVIGEVINISGGTYFPGAASSLDGTASSGPYFADFAKQAKALTDIPIVVTGGFEIKEQVVGALQDSAADAISLGRAMILDMPLANTWLSDSGGDPEFPMFDAPPRGGVSAWHSKQLTALGEDNGDQFELSPWDTLKMYNARDSERCDRWRKRFG